MKSSKVTLSAAEKNVVQTCRYALKVKNSGDGTILTGGADVVINGWPLEIGEVLGIDSSRNELMPYWIGATVAEYGFLEEFSKTHAGRCFINRIISKISLQSTENNDYLQA